MLYPETCKSFCRCFMASNTWGTSCTDQKDNLGASGVCSLVSLTILFLSKAEDHQHKNGLYAYGRLSESMMVCTCSRLHNWRRRSPGSSIKRISPAPISFSIRLLT